GGLIIKDSMKWGLMLFFGMTLLSGSSYAADYVVDNTTYLQVVTPGGVQGTFTLPGTEHTLEDGHTFTFLEGIYDTVNMVINRTISLVASGTVQLNGVIDAIAPSSITGFSVNGTVNLRGNGCNLSSTNITGTLNITGN